MLRNLRFLLFQGFRIVARHLLHSICLALGRETNIYASRENGERTEERAGREDSHRRNASEKELPAEVRAQKAADGLTEEHSTPDDHGGNDRCDGPQTIREDIAEDREVDRQRRRDQGTGKPSPPIQGGVGVRKLKQEGRYVTGEGNDHENGLPVL